MSALNKKFSHLSEEGGITLFFLVFTGDVIFRTLRFLSLLNLVTF